MPQVIQVVAFSHFSYERIRLKKGRGVLHNPGLYTLKRLLNWIGQELKIMAYCLSGLTFSVGGRGPEVFTDGNRLCVHTAGIRKVFSIH